MIGKGFMSNFKTIHQPKSIFITIIVSCADNFCEQFGPRSGPTKLGACHIDKLFDALMDRLIGDYFV